MGKILICVLASLAAAASSFHAAQIGLHTWARMGQTTYDDADIAKLAQHFIDATTLSDGRRLLVGLEQDSRVLIRGHEIATAHSEARYVRYTLDKVWREMEWFGGQPFIASNTEQEAVPTLVLLHPGASPPGNFGEVLGVPLQIREGPCDIRVGVGQNYDRLYQARILVRANPAVPLWSRAAAPCIARGLFATVGLVGEACAWRPSILCHEDALERGTQEDFLMLHTLRRMRAEDASSFPVLSKVDSTIRAVLAEQPANNHLVNLRREKLIVFEAQVVVATKLIFSSDEEMVAMGLTPGFRNRIRWLRRLEGL